MVYFTPVNVEHKIKELIQVKINLFFVCFWGAFLLFALFVFFSILSSFVLIQSWWL